MDWITGIDPLMAVAAFGIGIVVGLTGMGGGALMTPMMVLFFGVPPLTAVSSDLVGQRGDEAGRLARCTCGAARSTSSWSSGSASARCPPPSAAC